VAQISLVGPSYQSQSPAADAEVCQNWYVESIESGSGKGQYALMPTPGLATLINLGISAPVDALPIMIGSNNTAFYRLFAICGTSLIELILNNGIWTKTTVGTFASNANDQVFWAYGNRAIIMTVDGILYYFTDAGAFGSIPPSTFGGSTTKVTQVGYCDGFFLAVVAPVGGIANQIFASAPLDPTSWPGASTSIISVFPDSVLGMAVNQRQVQLLGQTASVTYWDSGNFPFPFDVVSGSYMESGTISGKTVVKLDNSIFWLDADIRGQAIVRRANGYTPTRVSNFAIEYAMQSYSRIDDAYAYGYQDQGHSFYLLTFPSAQNTFGVTWVYDVSNAMCRSSLMIPFRYSSGRCPFTWWETE
jgi:hypothetical protein